MRKLIITCLLLALVAIGCSSDPEVVDDTTTTTQGSGDQSTDETTTTTAAGTTTTTEAAETTTTAAASVSLDSCVIGTWLMNSEEFFTAVMEGLAAEGEDTEGFEWLGGEYRMTVSDDGTFSVVRDEWSFGVTSDQGNLRIVISAEDTGTWTLDGNVLSTTTVSDPDPDIQVFIDDVLFEFPGGQLPVQPPEAEFTGATIACDGDTMSASSGDDFASTWTRVG